MSGRPRRGLLGAVFGRSRDSFGGLVESRTLYQFEPSSIEVWISRALTHSDKAGFAPFKWNLCACEYMTIHKIVGAVIYAHFYETHELNSEGLSLRFITATFQRYLANQIKKIAQFLYYIWRLCDRWLLIMVWVNVFKMKPPSLSFCLKEKPTTKTKLLRPTCLESSSSLILKLVSARSPEATIYPLLFVEAYVTTLSSPI